MKESIQDWLIAKGFSVEQSSGEFTKTTSYFSVTKIPFSALAGHTLGTFLELARRKGWILETEL